jgi:endonuclease/exonuclease/phosphatase family metal-dependent hydrolase
VTVLRVMTWNLQNLFEAGAPDGPKTQAQFDAKIASLAAVINGFAPHVAALQEVGSESALAVLQAALSPKLPYRMVGRPDPRGIRVALLSRRVLRDRVDVTLFPPELLPVQSGDDPPGLEGPPTLNQLGRGALQATIRHAGVDVTIVACHLKSKLLTYPDGRFFPRDEGERARFAGYALNRRAAEAVTVRCHLNTVLDGQGVTRPVVLAGDLNDEPTAATTQILTGPPGSEIGTDGFDRPDAGDGNRLWNLAAYLPPGERFSRRYRDRGELIDHILVSHHLVQRIGNQDVHTVSAGPLPSIADDPNATRGTPGSDHAAVTAVFDL